MSRFGAVSNGWAFRIQERILRMNVYVYGLWLSTPDEVLSISFGSLYDHFLGRISPLIFFLLSGVCILETFSNSICFPPSSANASLLLSLYPLPPHPTIWTWACLVFFFLLVATLLLFFLHHVSRSRHISQLLYSISCSIIFSYVFSVKLFLHCSICLLHISWSA